MIGSPVEAAAIPEIVRPGTAQGLRHLTRHECGRERALIIEIPGTTAYQVVRFTGMRPAYREREFGTFGQQANGRPGIGRGLARAGCHRAQLCDDQPPFFPQGT